MMVHGIVFLMCFLIVHLCWLLGPYVLENRYIRRKQLSILETNWSILSACHAGCLGDYRVYSGWNVPGASTAYYYDGSDSPEATNGSSWFWVLLAQTFSLTSSSRYEFYSRALCNTGNIPVTSSALALVLPNRYTTDVGQHTCPGG